MAENLTQLQFGTAAILRCKIFGSRSKHHSYNIRCVSLHGGHGADLGQQRLTTQHTSFSSVISPNQVSGPVFRWNEVTGLNLLDDTLSDCSMTSWIMTVWWKSALVSENHLIWKNELLSNEVRLLTSPPASFLNLCSYIIWTFCKLFSSPCSSDVWKSTETIKILNKVMFWQLPYFPWLDIPC